MRMMMPGVLETLEESDSPTTYNSRYHDAHYLYFEKEFAQCRAHYVTPLLVARHCVVPVDVRRKRAQIRIL